MAFDIELFGDAEDELNSLRVFDRRRLVDELDEQLKYQPTVESRNRKCLPDLFPSFEYMPPIWELRVGEFRIFYDVDTHANLVHVRAIRRKGPGQTTEDIA